MKAAVWSPYSKYVLVRARFPGAGCWHPLISWGRSLSQGLDSKGMAGNEHVKQSVAIRSYPYHSIRFATMSGDRPDAGPFGESGCSFPLAGWGFPISSFSACRDEYQGENAVTPPPLRGPLHRLPAERACGHAFGCMEGDLQVAHLGVAVQRSTHRELPPGVGLMPFMGCGCWLAAAGP